MCFGVRDAIQLALDQVRTQPLTVLGDWSTTKPSSPNCALRGIKIAQHAAAVETQSSDDYRPWRLGKRRGPARAAVA